jgi:hypothetical protein
MRIVCIDFNGVLDAYQGWRGPHHFDGPRPGAREFLESLSSRGYGVVVFTTRYAPDVWRWLDEHGLADLVMDVTDRKPAAHVFVDDRAVCFRGDFASTLREIEQFSAHWGEDPAYADAADAGASSSTSLKQRRAYSGQLRRRSS